MKISFVSTVLNEQESIESFLDSLAGQSALPDEIIVADGGSKDDTVKIIEKYKGENQRIGKKIKIIKRNGVNRSLGRNQAIKLASGEVIAVADAGCLLDRDWLKEITKPFIDSRKSEVVSGYYLPTGETVIQKVLGTLTSVPISRLNPETFLPSSRSISFKKSLWAKAGGYPEELNYCEDLVFDLRLKKAGAKFKFAPKAIVFWPQKKTISGAARQFFNYAVGDGMAGFKGPHFKKLGLKLMFFLAVFLFFLRIAFLGFALWPWLMLAALALLARSRQIAREAKEIIALPLAFVLIPILNFAVFSGFIWGIVKNVCAKN